MKKKLKNCYCTNLSQSLIKTSYQDNTLNDELKQIKANRFIFKQGV